jgi:hypothetical protein
MGKKIKQLNWLMIHFLPFVRGGEQEGGVMPKMG